jgi:hypothetical protein
MPVFLRGFLVKDRRAFGERNDAGRLWPVGLRQVMDGELGGEDGAGTGPDGSGVELAERCVDEAESDGTAAVALSSVGAGEADAVIADTKPELAIGLRRPQKRPAC